MKCSEGNCRRTRLAYRSSKYPILFGFFIAILPKCPFCISAYSSAMVLCSGQKVFTQEAVWTNWISIGLASLTLLLIVLNYRGRRTWYAALFVVLGSFFIIRTELVTGNLTTYYLGAVMLLFGIWVNGSFLFLLKKLGLSTPSKAPSIPNHPELSSVLSPVND